MSRPQAEATASHLDRLEAESIHVLREVVAPARRPVLRYSMGKAFFPGPLPLPLLHVDTGWKFREMYAWREQVARSGDLELLTHRNPDGVARGIGPFSHGSQLHTDVMKTEGLKQALDAHGFDAAIGGARRDEEKSRAKERVISVRGPGHRWDPRQQRPEPWRLWNAGTGPGETLRVFPLSDWTELDVWHYIWRHAIPVVPLYFAAERPVVARNGQWILAEDERLPLAPGERPVLRRVRFRTLGCWPLTAAIESDAATVPEIVREMASARTSERQGRLIDHDASASMERKKREGYF